MNHQITTYACNIHDYGFKDNSVLMPQPKTRNGNHPACIGSGIISPAYPPRPVPSRTGSMNEYFAWFDGACEPINPGGTATFGTIIKDTDGTVLSKERGMVGKGEAMSNNVAEYAGVRHVLRYLASRAPGRATIRGDANLVINQLNGRWGIREGLYVPIATETRQLLADLCALGWQIDFCWIPREQNEECDALSKRRCHVTEKPAQQEQKDIAGNLMHVMPDDPAERSTPRGLPFFVALHPKAVTGACANLRAAESSWPTDEVSVDLPT